MAARPTRTVLALEPDEIKREPTALFHLSPGSHNRVDVKHNREKPEEVKAG